VLPGPGKNKSLKELVEGTGHTGIIIPSHVYLTTSLIKI